MRRLFLASQLTIYHASRRSHADCFVHDDLKCNAYRCCSSCANGDSCVSYCWHEVWCFGIDTLLCSALTKPSGCYCKYKVLLHESDRQVYTRMLPPTPARWPPQQRNICLKYLFLQLGVLILRVVSIISYQLWPSTSWFSNLCIDTTSR